MAYDALVESVRLIESRRLDVVPALSRRRRFAALAVDVAGDTAVTMFARRGVGCVWSETHVLTRREEGWHLVGGGGSSGDDDLLAPRPEVLEPPPGPPHAAGPAPYARVEGGGGVSDGVARAGRWPWSGRWIGYTELRVTAAVTSVIVGDREVLVPWHGRLVVLRGGRGGATVSLRDAAGRVLDTVRLPPS
ncbi:hypothetical protein [Phycicoccus sonneratiae]|uniref:Uncharacterized protein n=1 Tax=Phycicoccus sonneratiae TaxID=2807628 RepID=A0ABS2CH95_9MICO|nr:hypothetical protein [Phycicoccus sonneraticus]MBM6398818.1 hypothetical protein [Phycicoccus sonneraticus]